MPLMKAARCAPALYGGKPNDLAAGTASHQSNFLAARLNGTENPPKQPAIRRMSVKMFPSGVGRPSVTRRDERRFDHRMQRGERKCPQTRLWAQTSDGDTEHGRSL
jgi:hypothetical protein